MALLQCGLQITTETLSALALKQVKGGWTVAGGAMTQISTEGAELAPVLKSLVRPLKAAGAPFAIALPKQQAIMRNITLPSTDTAELNQMARFEIERHIPVHAERHCSGYHVMRKMGVEGSEVLLAAIDGPIVHRALEGAQGADMNPDGVTLSSVALCNTLIFSRRDWLRGKTVAVLSIGLDTLDLVLLTDGRILFARSVSIDLRSVLETSIGWHSDHPGSRPDLARLAHVARMTDCMKAQMQGAEKEAESGDNALLAGWLGRVVQEIRRTYDFARREMKCPPVEAVVLTGEGAILGNLDEYFRSNIDSEVVVVNPIAGLPGADSHKFPFDGFEFAIAFGAAIAGTLDGAYRIDLTPADFYKGQSIKRTKRKLITTGVIFAIALILAGASWYRFTTIKEQKLVAYNQVLDKMRTVAAELKEKKNRLEIIDRYMNDPNNAMAILSNVGNAPEVHSSVSVRGVNYTMAESVTLTGHAKTLLDIQAYVADLGKSTHGTDWVIQSREPQPVNDHAAYSFTVNGTMKTKETESGNATP
ncbi:pilus assembly protein PilM [bacterium]|nr:pilus assembly protein PilM [bacterium]